MLLCMAKYKKIRLIFMDELIPLLSKRMPRGQLPRKKFRRGSLSNLKLNELFFFFDIINKRSFDSLKRFLRCFNIFFLVL